MDRRSSSRAGALLLAVAALTVALVAASASSARTGEAPVITGDPVVGNTLTSSSAGDSGVYRWQRCDPATADCSAGEANDPDWVDIVDAGGGGVQTYTIPAADLGFHLRVLAKGTSLGEQFVASDPVGPVVAGPEPPAAATQEIVPQHGIQLIGDTTGGSVRFKPPGQTGYNPVTSETLIPVNSIIDARKGRVSLTAATGDFGNTTPDQSFEYYQGIFKILQPAAADSVAVAKVVGKRRCGRSAKSAQSSGALAQTAARRRGRLWGSGRGRYGTRGRGGTGSVVGTTYVTVEKCGGTYFKVPRQEGEGHGIIVIAKGKKKPVFLEEGESYLAER